MNLASTVATSRLIAQQRALDVTAHNLANLNTPGYRTQRMQFADWLARQSGDMDVNGGRVVAFAQDRASWREQRPGTLTQTGNPLDLSISGDGYFTVQTPNGTRLTRAGRFSMMPDGGVADDSGNKLLDANNQPLTLPPTTTRITISGDGTLSTETGPAGRIAVVKPTDPMALQAEGDQLFNATGPTEPVATPSIVQGTLEGSNVQPILETTRMMAALREFQFVSQFVQAEADRQKEAVDRILRPRA
jgi:flagellar basal-body rod protein FlgF